MPLGHIQVTDKVYGDKGKGKAWTLLLLLQ